MSVAMKPVDYVVLERIVCQRKPEVYKVESDYLAYEQLSALLENSRQTWSNIEMVYQFCERRQATTGKKKGKNFDVVGVYLQGKNGQTDFKYMEGLSFLVPVPDVMKDIVQFMKGGWNNEC